MAVNLRHFTLWGELRYISRVGTPNGDLEVITWDEDSLAVELIDIQL